MNLYSLTEQVLQGSVLIAFPIAIFAGIVAFVSPCVLPLVPAYFAYVTGLSGAEIVLHLTEWKEFRAIDPTKAKELVARANIIDGRNALDRDAWERAGWHFRALGRTTR